MKYILILACLLLVGCSPSRYEISTLDVDAHTTLVTNITTGDAWIVDEHGGTHYLEKPNK